MTKIINASTLRNPSRAWALAKTGALDAALQRQIRAEEAREWFLDGVERENGVEFRPDPGPCLWEEREH